MDIIAFGKNRHFEMIQLFAMLTLLIRLHIRFRRRTFQCHWSQRPWAASTSIMRGGGWSVTCSWRGRAMPIGNTAGGETNRRVCLAMLRPQPEVSCAVSGKISLGRRSLFSQEDASGTNSCIGRQVMSDQCPRTQGRGQATLYPTEGTGTCQCDD